MSKSTTISIALDEDAYHVFHNASEIVSKAGIRVPTGQLVQTMINAEISRLSARKSLSAFSNPSWSRSERSPARISMRRKMKPFQACPYRERNEHSF
jgi:hypothetical protein